MSFLASVREFVGMMRDDAQVSLVKDILDMIEPSGRFWALERVFYFTGRYEFSELDDLDLTHARKGLSHLLNLFDEEIERRNAKESPKEEPES